MKKIIAALILVATIFALSGCAIFEKCDICGDIGAYHEVHAVTTWNLCDDCYDNVFH